MVHPNVIFFDQEKIPIMELDTVVHVGGETIRDSTAYVIESAYSPQPKEVQVLIDKVAKFTALAKTDPHYQTVTKVVPVLAGHQWPDATVKAASAAKVWRVLPSGSGHQIVRSLHTAVRRMLK